MGSEYTRMSVENLIEWCKENDYTPKLYGKRSSSVVILGEGHTSKFRAKEEQAIQLLKPEYLLHEFLDDMSYDPKKQGMQGFSINIPRFGNITYHSETKDIEGLPFEEEIPFWIKSVFISFEHNIKHIFDWCDKYNMGGIGIDLSEFERDALRDKIQEEYPNSTLTSQSNKECFYREQRMGQKIAEIGTGLAIVGAYHIRKSSQIHQILKKNKIDYLCIDMYRFDII
jgi:hypothetical protein